MENLKKAVIVEIENRYTLTPADFVKESEGTKSRAVLMLNRPYGAKPYQGTPEQVEKKIRAAIERKKAKQIAKQMAKIAVAESAPDTLPNPIIIRLETYKGYMGWQWKGSDNYGHEGKYTGGCGYDKHSTALAEILNMHLPILKRMYKAKDKAIGKENRDAIGYGSGHGILPYFEGGVGSNCHVSILRGLGYEVTEGNDVFVITEK